MSLSGKDRKFRAGAGKDFPGGPSSADETFVQAIAQALGTEFGDSAGAVKTVGRLTGMNDRTVKNWFAAINTPAVRLPSAYSITRMGLARPSSDWPAGTSLSSL